MFAKSLAKPVSKLPSTILGFFNRRFAAPQFVAPNGGIWLLLGLLGWCSLAGHPLPAQTTSTVDSLAQQAQTAADSLLPQETDEGVADTVTGIQEETFEDSVHYSPYHVVVNHLTNLQPDNWDPAQSAQSLNLWPMPQEEKEDYAIKLKKVLDGRGHYIDANAITRKPDYVDSSTGLHLYPVHPDMPGLYVKKVGGQWRYAQASVRKIPQWYQETYPFGVDQLVDLLPGWMNNPVFGLELWKYLFFLAIVGVGLGLYWVFYNLVSPLLERVAFRYLRIRLPFHSLDSLTKPIGLVLLLGFLKTLLPVLLLPPKLSFFLNTGIEVAIPIFWVVVFYQVMSVVGMLMVRKAAETENQLDDQLAPMVARIGKFIVVIVGFVYILATLNFDVRALIAGVSIGGLAFALAAQDTLKNFFGSLMIFVDKPFQVGHWINTNGVDGVVEEVGFRATRIRTFYNSLVYLPNAKVTDSAIDNYGLRNYRRFYTEIGLMYSTPPHLLEAYVEGLREIIRSHPGVNDDISYIYLNSFADSSLNILFYVFLDVPDYGNELQVRQELMLGAIQLAHALGVDFAFPTQTLHIENMPGQSSLSPSYKLDDLQKAKSATQQALRSIKGAWEEVPEQDATADSMSQGGPQSDEE